MGWARENLGQARCEEILRELVPHVRRSGRALLARCPFPGHEDRHPSFQYDPERDRYRCWSHPYDAEAGGDLVDLWARLNGVPETEALKRFIERYAPEKARGRGDGAARKKRRSSGGSRRQGRDTYVPEADLEALEPLPETWIERLETKRGWTREIIQALDLRLWRPPKGMKDQSPRVAIPIRDDEGRLINIRLYRPGGAKRNKVLSWWRGKGREKISYGHPPRLWPAPSQWGPGRLWLVEGEPDCICALSRGLNAVSATGGAGTWRPEWGQHFRGREVVVCYDADPAGRKGAAKVAQALAGAGAHAFVLSWPEFMESGQDLTDWFVAHGQSVEDLEALAEQAEAVRAEGIDEDARQRLIEAADALIRYKAWSEFDQKVRYRPILLVEDILHEHQLITDPTTKQVFRWVGTHWALSSVEDLKKLVIAKLGVAATRARVGEAVELIMARSALPEGEEMDPHPELLCVQNGMLDLNTGELRPHDPSYRCTRMFPYEWRPHDPPDCPRFKRYLWEALGNSEVIDEVLEFIGYCLWPGQQYKKALLMVGAKDCGKSLLQEIIRRLLGPENCSAVDMADLEDQFQRVALHRKLANICGETKANFFSSNNFKRLTGGDPIQAAYKGVDTFTFVTQAKLIFAANEFPRVADHSDAFYERMLAVHFPRQFKLGEPGTDPHLLERIVPAELPGIFHLAVARLYYLRRRGAFSQCAASRRFLHQYRVEINNVAQFIEEKCQREADGQPAEGPKSEVFSAYKTWCEANGFRPVDRSVFWRRVRQHVPSVRFKDHGPGPGRPPWVVGLYLRETASLAA
jgi:putative DNA primase/helicase